MDGATRPPENHDISHFFEPVGGRSIGGRGAFNAGVFVVRGKRSGRKFVEKRFNPEDILNGSAEFEMFVQRELNHKNIVKYITGFIDETGPWGPTASLYLEFCDKGNLYDYVVKRYSTGHLIPEMWIWDVFVQLVDAVAFMQYGVQNACRNPEEPGHWIGVVHRDIKLDNIFLCSIPGSSKVRACLGDFGQAIREDDDGNWGRQYMGGNLGTAPPEVQQGGFDLYSYEGDVWALGCCISAMCQPGVEPALMQLAGPYYSESLSLAINYLMQYDARDRPNMIEFASNMLEWRRQGLGPRPYSYTY